MTFPAHVDEVKKHLQDPLNCSDEKTLYLKTLCKLTEPVELEEGSDAPYLPISDYEGMWVSLFRAEQENNDFLDNKWVLDFLDAVTASTDLPPYFYIKGKESCELIDKIRKHTAALEKIYTTQGFNQNLISNDGQFFHGFSPCDTNGNRIVDNKGRPPKVSVIDTLQFFAERAEEEINESAHRGKAGRNVEAIRFIRILAERNFQSYGRPLNAVLKTAAFALYELEYSESDISNLRNRRKKKTSP